MKNILVNSVRATYWIVPVLVACSILASCSRYSYLPHGKVTDGLTNGSATIYSNDSLKIKVSDFARMHFAVGALTSADRLILKRLRHKEHSVKVLFTSYNQMKMLPSHRLIGVWRTTMPTHWQKQYQAHAQHNRPTYYFQQLTSRKSAVYDCIIPTASAYLELVWEIPFASKPAAYGTMQDYLFDEMNFVLDELRLDSDYHKLALPNPFAVLSQAFGSTDTTTGNYSLPIYRLREMAPSYLASTDADRRAFLQAISTAFSFINEPDSVADQWHKLGGQTMRHQPPVPVVSATETVLTRTAAAQIVMFNENHVQPKGRYWLGSLLPDLYQQGFRYLALEALRGDTLVQKWGYPTLSSGFYLREPHLANLVREAVALGFTVVSYDALSATREQDQAQNIVRRTLQQDPHAKVVVLAGIGHINEDTTYTKAMAAWIRTLSGIDPLTVNQTTLDELTIATEQEGVFLPKGNVSAVLPTQSMVNDLYVVNRITISTKGNDFGRSSASPINIVVPSDSLPRGKEFMLLVYHQREWRSVHNPVPVWIRFGKELRHQLHLQTGQYVVVAKIGNTSLWTSELSVP